MKAKIPDGVSKYRSHRDDTIDFYRRAVERVISAMRSRLSDPLEVSTLAKIAITSPFHFIRIFKEITGISPVRFLAALRIERAKKLLLGTDLSVTEICFQVGYNSLGTFTRIFTDFVGLSPGQLRRFATRENVGVSRQLESRLDLTSARASESRSVPVYLFGPAAFSGNVFVGLFRTPIPQGRPAAGALVQKLGLYKICDVPDGLYYSLAAAFPASPKPLDYILPQQSSLFVANGLKPTRIIDGQASDQIRLTLRPLQAIDPPILITLPLLLIERKRQSLLSITHKF